MSNQTPLYEQHLSAGGKMVDFAGWEMPINYGSQVQEHHKVRQDVGMFDVSHMTVVDFEGQAAREFLRVLLANDVNRLKESGKALYSCMLNESGGVIDDLIVYFLHDEWYRMVVNAGTREKDMAWIKQQAKDYNLTVTERPELAMIAVQGPNAEKHLTTVLSTDAKAISSLTPFNALDLDDYFIARTGYTGEDGFEIILSAAAAVKLWDGLTASGVPPIGLGARDTLRLEAGLNLYGHDMDDSISPLEAGLGWTIAWEPAERKFMGREALESIKKNKPKTKLVGLVLEGKGVIRDHQKVVVAGLGDGKITSGSFSPTIGRSIAFARVPAGSKEAVSIEIRGKLASAKIVKVPFVRKGKVCI
ncbi:Aminomethyltransferase (glycine cleavage system T protein) [hydrothermal vent metagenome]|uniref:aminomethyltransferase n=1 Tax=hydrothermal vent metagenome TaxID=652676 RepID=A0A3B0YFT0_9ZZZZ